MNTCKRPVERISDPSDFVSYSFCTLSNERERVVKLSSMNGVRKTESVATRHSSRAVTDTHMFGPQGVCHGGVGDDVATRITCGDRRRWDRQLIGSPSGPRGACQMDGIVPTKSRVRSTCSMPCSPTPVRSLGIPDCPRPVSSPRLID